MYRATIGVRSGTEEGVTKTVNGNGVDDVISAVHDDMVFGQLKPRERLVELEMVQRYGAPRSVVRRALDELEHRGVVSRQPNKGAEVHDFSQEEVYNICEVRVLLQERAAATIPLPANPDWIAKLDRYQAEHAAAVERRDVEAAYRLNTAFHREFFSACPNRYLVGRIDEITWLMDVVRSYRMLGPALNARAPREHREIIDAASEGDRDKLVRLCIAHVPAAEEIYSRINAWSGRARQE